MSQVRYFEIPTRPCLAAVKKSSRPASADWLDFSIQLIAIFWGSKGLIESLVISFHCIRPPCIWTASCFILKSVSLFFHFLSRGVRVDQRGMYIGVTRLICDFAGTISSLLCGSAKEVTEHSWCNGIGAVVENAVYRTSIQPAAFTAYKEVGGG